MNPRARKLGTLHALKREQGLSDDLYRDKLERVTGARSAASLTDTQLDQAIAAFHVKQKANNPYTAKIKALYLAAANLGAFDSVTDAAIDAFVQRQTGKARLAFITPAEAGAVTEALKAICSRYGFGVPAGDAGGMEGRRALLYAQWSRLAQMKAVIPSTDALESFVSVHYLGFRGSVVNLSAAQADAAAKRLGRWIRKVQAERGA